MVPGRGALVRALAERHGPLVLERSGERLPAPADSLDRAVLEGLAAAVLVPIRHGAALPAFLCLGEKRSGDVYTSSETALLAAIGAETMTHHPEPLTKALVITTLILAWLFSNTIYAIHYAHLAYIQPDAGDCGLEFPGTKQPSYWDFVYFAYTLGMTFQTSDVTITDERIRRVVTVHCFAAFVFNIGVLAFTINVLGSS